MDDYIIITMTNKQKYQEFLEKVKKLANEYDVDIETTNIAEYLDKEEIEALKNKFGVDEPEIEEAWLNAPYNLKNSIEDTLFEKYDKTDDEENFDNEDKNGSKEE